MGKLSVNFDGLELKNPIMTASGTYGYANEFDEFIELYDRLCKKRGFLIRGGEIDYNRAGKTFVDDFRAGKFGRITLE